MSEKKISAPKEREHEMQWLSDRVGRLERSFQIVLMDLEEETRHTGTSTNFWLFLIALYFLAGVLIGQKYFAEPRKRGK